MYLNGYLHVSPFCLQTIRNNVCELLELLNSLT